MTNSIVLMLISTLAEKGFVEEARSIPKWEAWINRRYKAFDKGWVLVLYRQIPAKGFDNPNATNH